MRDDFNPEQAGSFGRAAAEYERARPEYPAAAVEWLLPAGARDVVDLGAGTGKLTRALVARDLAVTAVEPLAGMREQLEAAVPGVPALEGRAEQIPLPDDSADLVTVAQAWHWVDEELAAAEVARVLRPGGSLALIWNLRDERADWVERLTEAIGRGDAERLIEAGFELPPPFGPTERAEFEWDRELDRETLVELVSSRSYVITATPTERERILAAVRELAATDPELAGRERFPLPYVTQCFRARLPG